MVAITALELVRGMVRGAVIIPNNFGSVPAVFDSLDPDAADGLRLKVGQSSHADVYVSVIDDGRVFEAKFPGVLAGARSSLTLNTTNSQQLEVKDDAGGVVATAVLQLVDSAESDGVSSPPDVGENSQPDVGKSKISDLTAALSDRASKVKWSFYPPQESLAFEVRGYKRARKNAKFVVSKRLKGSLCRTDNQARLRLKRAKSQWPGFVRIIAVGGDRKPVHSSRFVRVK